MQQIDDVNDMEIEVLRILNGEDIPGWIKGAAMNACCEYLKENGYAKGHYEISEKGKKFLEKLDNQQ